MAKRANGEGSVYQAGARWRGAVTLPDGRRKYVSAGTQKEALAQLRQVQRSADDGLAISTDGRTCSLAEWLGLWLTGSASGRVRPSTLRRYEQLCRVHIVPVLGRIRVDRLQPEQVEKLYRQLRQDGLAPATALQVHRVLSRALKVAMQRGIVVRNVCTLVDAPSVPRTEVEPLTSAEARSVLLEALKGRNSARWIVALALGVRQGEALGLTWDCVDLEAGTITIRSALQRQSGAGLVLVQPKSRAGRRVLTLPPSVRDAVLAHRTRQLEERLAAGQEWSHCNAVFATEMGTFIDPRNDRREWQTLLVRAGVRRARLHDARHTAATLLLTEGVPARVVMDILGHSQISLTLGTYSHVVPELRHDAAARMERALWG